MINVYETNERKNKGAYFMQLFIIRHADPDYATDSLTEAGHLEAEALGEYMKGIELDELYASPLGRAQETAEYVSKSTGLPIQTEEWTRELQGLGVKLPNGDPIVAWDYPGELIPSRQEDFTEWHRSEDYWLKQPHVKKLYDEMIMKSDEFFKRLGLMRKGGVYEMTDPAIERKKIALVCHGGFGMTWLSHLLHLPLTFVWQAFWIAPSSVTTILFEKRHSDLLVPRCLRSNEVTHLREANLPVQKNGIWATNYDPRDA